MPLRPTLLLSKMALASIPIATWRCAALAALDRTDGTTDSTNVLAAIDEMRRTAPRDIRDDVNQSLDSLVLGDFPEAVDASMKQVSLEERQAAAGRMVAYVEQHCPDRDSG